MSNVGFHDVLLPTYATSFYCGTVMVNLRILPCTIEPEFYAAQLSSLVTARECTHTNLGADEEKV